MVTASSNGYTFGLKNLDIFYGKWHDLELQTENTFE